MRNLILVVALLLPLAEAAAADARAGEKKAQMCTLCHRPDSPLGGPTLEQQPYRYLVDQTTAYRTGKRRSPAMDPNVERLTPRDIQDIAAWFSSQAARPARIVMEPDAATIARGEQAARDFDCGSCHARDKRGPLNVPRLDGQPPGYLALRIAELKSGKLHPRLPASADKFDESTAQALGAWFGKLQP